MKGSNEIARRFRGNDGYGNTAATFTGRSNGGGEEVGRRAGCPFSEAISKTVPLVYLCVRLYGCRQAVSNVS